MVKDAPCFIMLCNGQTEQECLRKGLFGDREWQLDFMSTIQAGHLGFLLNVTKDGLLGVFQAEGPAKLNIDPAAWNGAFPAQVKVRLVGELQRVTTATDKLDKILKLRIINPKSGTFAIPANKVHGPEVTQQVLGLFEKRPALSTAGLPRTDQQLAPVVTFEAVAGLENVKQFVYQRLKAPFDNEQAAHKLGLRIGGGMLLFGPPGTGKTLIAVSVASDLEAKLIEISPSVIMGYPGEAEKRLEGMFASLEKEPRAVILLDEAEWILCKRESQSSSVMQRITPVLLAQLGRLFKERSKPVVVIAVTNKPDKIDPAFLRPGRFDKAFYVGLPSQEARTKILGLQLAVRSHNLTDGDLKQFAERLEGYSGADIVNIVEEAAFVAFAKDISCTDPRVTAEDVRSVIARTAASVMAEEVASIEAWARERQLLPG